MAKKVLITGANRGIGLALVGEYLKRGEEVFAGCRKPDEADRLNKLAAQHGDRLHVFRLEVTRSENIAAAAQLVWSRTETLDILINNAGINPEPSADVKLGDLQLQDCRDAIEVNALGPARITRAMLPLLEKGGRAVVANITSGVACMSAKTRPGYYAYGMSKAALNYFTRAMAAELRSRGLIVVLISPGWVKTDMGGPDAELPASQSAAGIAATIDKLRPEDNSFWFNWDGRKQETW